MIVKIIPQAFLNQSGRLERSWAVSINAFPIKDFSSEHELLAYLKDLQEAQNVSGNS